MKTESKLIIFVAVLASLLEIIDTSIVNVAIPSMMGNLGATLENISWVVTGYIIANAIVLPLSGWLGMQFGRREYYTSCILIFTAASVACGLSPNLQFLVVFRVIQGLAGGALLPTSQTLIQEQFPREKAGTASAIYGMSVMIGPTLGPTLGGYLTDHFGWRSIFNINLPLGVFAATLASIYIKNPVHAQTPKRMSVDWKGLALLAIGIGCLQYVLERGQADEWFNSTAIRICSLMAVVSIPWFIFHELKISNPILNIRLFKERIIRSGTLLMMSLGMMLYGLVFLLPIFMNRLLHFDATQTGMMFIPGALLTAFTMPVIGKLLRTVDARILILFGTLLIECMLFMLTQFSPQTGAHELFWTLIVRGLAMGFLFVPINSVVLGHFRGPELGQAAGMMNLFRQLGGSIGIAILGTLLDRYEHQNFADLSSKVSLLSYEGYATFERIKNGLRLQSPNYFGLRTLHEAALHQLSFRIDTQVFVMSFTQSMWVILFAYACSLIPLIGLRKN